jgi:small subunit ribosomal protein S6
MTNYELMLIIDPSLEQEKKDEEIEKVKAVIAENGKVGETDVWGIRKLGYPIGKNTDGYYVVLQFLAEPDLPKELDRRLRISDTVMRHMIINKNDE